MYCIVVRDHINKCEKIVKHLNSFENSLNFIQEYYEDYIYEFQGNLLPNGYFNYEPNHFTFKEGLYIFNKDYLRYKVVKRVRTFGILLNGYIDTDIFSISIAKDETLVKLPLIPVINDKFEYRYIFDDIIFEIREMFNPHSTHFKKEIVKSKPVKNLISSVSVNDDVVEDIVVSYGF